MKSLFITITCFLVLSEVAFSQPRNVYDVYAIEYSSSKSKVPVSNISIGGSSTDSVSFSYYFWFLNGDPNYKLLNYLLIVLTPKTSPAALPGCA